MPKPLRCPTCSAPLEIPAVHASAVRCPYCGAGVLLAERGGHVEASAPRDPHGPRIAAVLDELRAGQKIAAIKLYRQHFHTGLKEAREAVERLAAGQPAGSLPGYAESAGSGRVLLALLGAGLVAGVGLFVAVTAVDPPAGSPADAPTPAAAPLPATPRTARPAAEAEEFAREVMRFGSEGTGAGRFQDARGVAVDGAGRIYVAEYSGGRVQVFDSAGAFLTQWMADARMPLLDLEADRGGTVYVVQSGRIRRYEGASGTPLGEMSRRNMGYRDVALALDGSLWAVSGGHVVHLSPDGGVRREIDVRQAVGGDATPARVAVSGTGDLYVLDQWKAHVYHLAPDGRFVDRFGGGGFPPAEDVAVDGRGRVYVSDLGSAIHVFDAAGQPLGEFGGRGVVFGLAVDDGDALFATFRNQHQVVKFRVP